MTKQNQRNKKTTNKQGSKVLTLPNPSYILPIKKLLTNLNQFINQGSKLTVLPFPSVK